MKHVLVVATSCRGPNRSADLDQASVACHAIDLQAVNLLARHLVQPKLPGVQLSEGRFAQPALHTSSYLALSKPGAITL